MNQQNQQNQQYQRTNLLQENDYDYQLQDVKEPVLYRDMFSYDEVPKIRFNHREVPVSYTHLCS